MGRPTKLTEELARKIAAYMEAGNYFETACILGGISERCGYNWLKRGEKENGLFRQFFQSIKKAECVAENEALAYIQSGFKNWQSKAWFLERRFRDRWSAPSRVEVAGKDGGPILIKEVEVRLS